MYLLGIDPGRKGGFALYKDGAYLGVWDMPLIAGKVTGVGIGNLYREIAGIVGFGSKIQVIIEKVQAMPHDGKVGMCSYWKGAGLLEMVHLWQWPIILVPPSTWCSKLHAGISKDLPPKKRSEIYISQRYPHFLDKGGLLWPEGSKKLKDGRLDAVMLVEYARRAAGNEY